MLISPVHPGSYAPDFELPGIDGSVHHLRQYLTRFRAVGVIFLNHEDLRIGPDMDALIALQAGVVSQGCTLIGINANQDPQLPGDRLNTMATFAHQHGLSFPYLRDETQEVAEAFGVTQLPQAFLVNHQGLIVHRSERLDPLASEVTGPVAGLSQAIAALLAVSPF